VGRGAGDGFVGVIGAEGDDLPGAQIQDSGGCRPNRLADRGSRVDPLAANRILLTG
jgi:hypothetical protein